jgi:predicted phosphodiesterase
MRLIAISDLHVDYLGNRAWVQGLDREAHREDVLILAGDVSHRLSDLSWCLSTLQSRFHSVFFVPGNHELWLSPSADKSVNSFGKFHQVLKLCRSLGVHTDPATLDLGDRKLTVLPLFSWYEAQSDGGHDLEGWMDFTLCRWPIAKERLPQWFADWNEEALTSLEGEVVSFSHFVPRVDLLPAPAVLDFKELAQVSCSALIERQLRAARSTMHVFGHSHIPVDRVMDGVRYVNHPLGYPGELRQAPSLKVIRTIDSALKSVRPNLPQWTAVG